MPALSEVEERTAGVAAVLAVSRVAALAGHQLAWSWWSPIAYLWQDACVVLAYAAIDIGLRRTRRIAWIAYAAFVSYVGLGVPVMRVLSTPMTWTMWRAAGGALSDSIWLYVTPANLLWIGLIVVASIGPLVVAQAFRPAIAGLKPCATFLLIAFAALGPSAVARVDTRGLDRNAWSALVISARPRAAAASAIALGPAERRRGLQPRPPTVDLARFRGAATNRNVILVSLESTPAQYLSLYGAADEAMPNLTKLARSAIVFDHAYAVYPESIKGLFSVLCSQYPALDRPADVYEGAGCRSIASRLSERGSHTALFHSGRFDYLGMHAVVRKRGFDLLADAGNIGGEHESSFGVDDRTTVSRMLAWIDDLPRSERFFLTYLPIAGHHPYESPGSGPFSDGDEFGRYRNALHYGDAALADLMNGLQARGLDKDTVWIVLSDHGEAFGQHDGNFGHTFQLYEENVRVPFFIAAPGLFPHQLRTSQIVSLIDTAPTILDLLGLPADASYQGATALTADSRMAFFFADYSMRLVGLRDGHMKYIYELDSRRSQLFDLDRDPQELHDIAAGHAQAIRWYEHRALSFTSALAMHD
jgi:phosphoglycerol transferase MdoB-like AlkP superfamily enzyme